MTTNTGGKLAKEIKGGQKCGKMQNDGSFFGIVFFLNPILMRSTVQKHFDVIAFVVGCRQSSPRLDSCLHTI